MTVPLVVLAVLSVVGGWVGIAACSRAAQPLRATGSRRSFDGAHGAAAAAHGGAAHGARAA